MEKKTFDGTGLLKLYDRVTGVFNEIFDARLLVIALAALIGYCTLFTQRKFPMRWSVFVLFGMILLMFVTLTARIPGRAHVRFHRGMALLWFALHGMMVVSGLFYEDWLPESVPLLICYPIVFSVFSSRGDEGTFRAILRGVLAGTVPFLLATLLLQPLTWGYPGYRGIFYDANCLSMTCIVCATAALLLAYAGLREGHRKEALISAVIGVAAAVILMFTMSRSGLLAFAGVALILSGAILAGTVKHPKRWIAALLVLLALLGCLGWRFTKEKLMQAYEEDYALAVYNHETYGNPITVPRPEERVLSMDDLTSDRWGIWQAIVSNATWNGHPTSVVQEWVAQDGSGERHFNAHNAFLGITYNNGWIAGLLLLAYTVLAFVRAMRYYWRNRCLSPLAATPLAFCAVFILVGLFESVYAPFSLIGCCFLLVQAPIWRADDLMMTGELDA